MIAEIKMPSKRKTDRHGQLNKYKVVLGARGFTHLEGVHFTKSFAACDRGGVVTSAPSLFIFLLTTLHCGNFPGFLRHASREVCSAFLRSG